MDDWNGSVPAWELEELVERVRRDPPHPGLMVRDICERKGLSAPEAARMLAIAPAELVRVWGGQSPITPELALRMEAAGWPAADLWTRLQADYDLAHARRRRERAGSASGPVVQGAEAAPTAS